MKNKHVVSSYLAVWLISLVSLAQGATPDWIAKLPEAVKWQNVTSVGTLLVGTDKAVYSIHPETGEVVWSRPEFEKSAPFNVREIPGTPILLVNDQPAAISPQMRLHAVDLLTGQILWETEKTAGYSVGAYPINSKGLVLVFANLYNHPDGAGMYMAAYDLATGKQLWQTKHSKSESVPLYPAENSGSFFAKFDLSGHQEPLVEGDVVYVPFAGVHCFDLKTGALKWGVPFQSVPKQFKRGSAPLVIEGDVIYASAVNRVFAIDKNTGVVKWESKKVSSGTVTQLLPAGDKLLVRMGGNLLDWGSKTWVLKTPLAVFGLDKATGAAVWEYRDFKDGLTNMQLVEGADAVFVADAQNLIGIDLSSSGKVKEAFKVKLEFKRKLGGGEAVAKIGLGALGGIGGLLNATVKASTGKDRMDIPVAIISQGKGQFVVRGRQHLLSFDAGKKEINWSTYYAAPGASGFEMAIMTALTAASGVMYNGAYASGSMSLDNASSGIKQSLDRYERFANKRYSATQSGSQRTYVLTSVEEGKSKGNGLMAIDMTTGDAAAQLLLNDKEPEYTVDDASGRLYYLKGHKEIHAYTVR